MHGEPVGLALFAAVTALAVLTFAFALMRGGAAERLAAAVYGAEWFGGLFVILVVTRSFQAPMIVPWLMDLLMAAVFLYLALRYRNGWMAAGAVAQGVQMGLRAIMIIVGEIGTGFSAALDWTTYAMSFVMIGCIFGSTLSHQRVSALAH